MENGFEVTDALQNSKFYGGVTRKFGVTVDGVDYIVKFARSGLTSQIYSEYVASSFIRNIGVPCQEVWIGFYRGRMINIIRDFKKPGEMLHAFEDTKQSSVDTDLSDKGYTYEDVIRLLEQHTKMAPGAKEIMLAQFWDQFICDAILGNRDRHQGNWGYLTTPSGYVPAPLYDNGGSLFPDMGTEIKRYSVDKYAFLSARAEKFPASLFKSERANGEIKRTNYYEVCGQIAMPELAKRLTLEDVWEAISRATDYVAEPYGGFYRQITCMRFLHIIKRVGMEEAYEQLRHFSG